MKKTISLLLAVIMMSTFIAGCTPKKENTKAVDIKEVHSAIKEELGEDYYPNMELSKDELKNLIGINEDDIETYIAEVPMISVNIDTFIAIKAKEGKGDKIKADLDKYKEFLVEESFQYPMNLAKVEASSVLRYGDYLFFLMLGKYDERQESTDDERIEFAKAEIKRVEDIIDKFFK